MVVMVISGSDFAGGEVERRLLYTYYRSAVVIVMCVA